MPGTVIDISAVCKAKNFKDKGNKPAAIEACRRLEEEGLRTLHELGSLRGTPMLNIFNILQPSELPSWLQFLHKYEFRKIPSPESKKEQADLAIKLAKFGVTLKSYASSLDKKEIVEYNRIFLWYWYTIAAIIILQCHSLLDYDNIIITFVITVMHHHHKSKGRKIPPQGNFPTRELIHHTNVTLM